MRACSIFAAGTEAAVVFSHRPRLFRALSVPLVCFSLFYPLLGLDLAYELVEVFL